MIKKEFSRENYSHKEKSDDYETKYAEYITQMKELIEKEKTSSANTNTDAPGEENERKAKFDNLLKDFCNMLKEKATISAKIEATETIKNQIPKGSYLLEELNDFLFQRDRLEMNTADLCTKLKELDINFNENEQIKKNETI